MRFGTSRALLVLPAVVVAAVAVLCCGGDDDAAGNSSSSSGGNGEGGLSGSSGNPGSPDGSSGGFDSGPTAPKNCGPKSAPAGTTFYVAPNGNDANDGSTGSPWATITKAVTAATDGATVLVRPGTYNGSVRLDRAFVTGIVIRSETPYAAKLRNNQTVVRSFSGQHITLEGFDIAHTGPTQGPLVIQIQKAEATPTSHIVLRNNVIHDSLDNDLIKLNNGAEHVTIEGNVFYNQAGSDEHIDVNSVRDCIIQDNIFFNDFAGSGRTKGNDTSAFVVVKDSNADDDGILGSERITIRRNVFLNWEGGPNYGFLQLGEDGTANFEAVGVMIENNLLIGNGGNTFRTSFAMQGVKDITFRHNTVVGDFHPNTTFGFAARMIVVDDNQPNQNIQFWNNVWSDPSGTMQRLAIAPSGETTGFTAKKNLYWNNGAPIPSVAGDVMTVAADTQAVTADPKLGAQTSVAVPRLDGTTFKDGSTSICQAFERLVTTYGTPEPGSAAIDAADPAESPDHDILTRPRSGAKDLGAVER